MSGSPGRFSTNSLRRLITSMNSIRFRDESGEIEYFGQKVVLLRRDVFGLIRGELSRVAGPAANVIISLAGRKVGTEEGQALALKAEALGLNGPQAFPDFLKTAVEETNMGIGKIRVSDLDLQNGRVDITVVNGFESDRPGGSLKPTCFFTLGYLEGIFSKLTGKELRGREVACNAKGDTLCRFSLNMSAQ
ncbi:hypothetical protein E6H36_02440 [Candidatus Bathyarchaeota archaeon]|nr:MAG: hypothetical protein E6H36_02440 [Candidatus Bathyarchaeota archaeon]TMI30124.1 MAG: hypothetical protein E6H29_09105 [Candidatus Bathyarchaeota archaeon]